jgi:hypothetical protein
MAKTNKIITSSLLNIDSSFRNIQPKHIYNLTNKIIKSDPIKFTEGSNIIKFIYEDHGFVVGDNIIIQNVIGKIKILYQALYLIDNFDYAIINIENNDIPENYTKYVNDLYINIEIIGEQQSNNFINNIPFNSIIGIKKSFIANDIINLNENVNKLSDFLYNSHSNEILNTKFLFIPLNIEYSNNTNYYYLLNDVFKISYLHINGIKLGNLNANYPINNYNYQNSYMITNIINNNEFEITLNFTSFASNYSGGNNVQIYKILNSVTGYPNSDNYVINLKKNFNNVINIELVSTEIPYVDILIKKNINDKLYWKNIEDGNNIYTIQLDEGFYTTATLFDKLNKKLNSIPRIISTITNVVNNNFDIILEPEIHKITFKPYNLTKLPNSLSIRLNTINSELFYILNINHPNNIIETNDIITIFNASDVTVRDEKNQIKLISSSYLNKSHIVYSVNLDNQTYDIILGKKSEIAILTNNYDLAGGENIIVKSKTKISFLFNRPDTLGQILGFKNIPSEFSITEFKSEISNQDNYINSINLNSVGNEYSYSNGFFNLTGKYNYILMFLNDIECIYSNNDLPSAFAKILLSGNPGDILFNTFINFPKNIYSKTFPIITLSTINVSFLYPDGTPVNFRNIDHSFTLKITEEKIQNTDTYLNSNIMSIDNELSNII